MDKRLVLLVSIFFLAFGAFAISVFFATTSRSIRATNAPVAEVVCLTSAVSASTVDSVTITCILRDKDKGAIADRQCCIRTTFGNLNNECIQSDTLGKTQATLTSQTPGLAQLTCLSENFSAQTSVQFE